MIIQEAYWLGENQIMENGICLSISHIRTRQIVVQGKIDHKKTLFLIDTGASESVFHIETARDYGLVPEVVQDQHGAGVGSSNITVFQLPRVEIELGGHFWELGNPVAMDLSHVIYSLKRHKARAVSIILGADLLRRYKAVIDYGKKEMWLFPDIPK